MDLDVITHDSIQYITIGIYRVFRIGRSIVRY